MELFRTHGYEQLPIETLTDAMGIGRGSLYAAFGSKRELYLEALNAFVDRALAWYRSTLLDVPGSALTSVRGFVAKWSAIAESSCGRGCFVTNSLIEKSQADPEVARIVSRFLREEEILLRGVLSEAVEKGELPVGRDPATLARAIANARLGLTLQARLGADPQRVQSIIDGVLLLLS
jgi:TetR/AcrR family transcriptional repressor of nem operon